jgi:hypothetical protein
MTRFSFFRDLTETIPGRVLVTLMTAIGIVVPVALTSVHTDLASAHTLSTPIDDAIAFLPWTVYIYSWVYTSMLLPLFVVRDGALFRRVVAAYVLVGAQSVVMYWVFPVTSLYLRPDLSGLDTTVFHNWAMRLTYWVDPPANLFPSLHVGTALISALAAYKARPLYFWLSLPIVLGICVTICTTKQHYIADGILALVVVWVAWKFTLASYRSEDIPASTRALTWRGPVAYFAFHCSFYGVVYAIFLMVGDLPW